MFSVKFVFGLFKNYSFVDGLFLNIVLRISLVKDKVMIVIVENDDVCGKICFI